MKETEKDVGGGRVRQYPFELLAHHAMLIREKEVKGACFCDSLSFGYFETGEMRMLAKKKLVIKG